MIRRRENKWLHMLDHWDKYMLEKYKKVRHRCRKGIPPSIRPRAWQHLCGAKYRMSRQPGTSPTYSYLFACKGKYFAKKSKKALKSKNSARAKFH